MIFELSILIMTICLQPCPFIRNENTVNFSIKLAMKGKPNIQNNLVAKIIIVKSEHC